MPWKDTKTHCYRFLVPLTCFYARRGPSAQGARYEGLPQVSWCEFVELAPVEPRPEPHREPVGLDEA
jgi:hypothetical protein